MRASVYKRYLLTVLMIILAFNYADRLAVGVLLEKIKLDLRASDTQLGFMTGIAFALFYSVMGIPMARWADRGNRATIISIAVFVWSVMVSMCGFARTFSQLLVIRVGVAVGEAGCIPPANSLIPDYFNRTERPRAVSIYLLGGSISAVFGYFIAGWLEEFYGWRITFVLLGAPGIAFAVLAKLTLLEPRVGEEKATTDRLNTDVQPALRQVFRTLISNRTFRQLLLCLSVMSFFAYGITQWQPTFFVRAYGLKTGELGTWFAVIAGSGGLVGTLAGGAWATKYAGNNECLQLKALMMVLLVLGVVSPLIYMTSAEYVSFFVLGLTALGTSFTNGPVFSIIQTLVSPSMRATAIATIYLCSNLVGMGLGPLAAGILSDSLRPFVGDESLRYALLALCPGYFWGGWHLWMASKTVTMDVRVALARQENAVHLKSESINSLA